MIVVVYNYLQITNFFWMLVEGLSLHVALVWSFQADRIKLWHYCILGWGVPAPIVVIWGVVKSQYENDS